MSTTRRPCLLGVPWDRSASFERGAAAAPPLIRKALWSPSTNSATELGVAIDPGALDDAGDLILTADGSKARVAIEAGVGAILARHGVPVVLGGDHSVTYPVLRAWRDHPVAAILHFDAHGDLYDEFPLPEPGQPRGLGDPYSHACPFARIMEEGLSPRLMQVGVRTMTPHLAAQAERFGVECYGMDRWRTAPVDTLAGPLYISIDLDGLDPAFAPGVSHPEPGGLSTRDVVELLHRIRAPIAGIDIVEYNPGNDHRDLTARVAAKLLKEAVAVAMRNTQM
jgi:arginase